MAVDHLSLVVPRGQRTMKFIVDGVDLVGEACPHVLNCILHVHVESKKAKCRIEPPPKGQYNIAKR